jgi:hypothetical protein
LTKRSWNILWTDCLVCSVQFHLLWDRILIIHAKNIQDTIGLFTVVIFGPFSAHFRLHFWLIFECLAEEWSEWSEKWNKKWCEKWLLWTPWKAKIRKMMQKCILHGPRQCWQVLGIFKLPLKWLGELFFQVHNHSSTLTNSLLGYLPVFFQASSTE